MSVNAAQFERELLGEVEDLSQDFMDFKADIVGDILSVAEKRTTAGSIKNSWGAGLRDSFTFDMFRGSAQARADIRKAKPGTPIFFGNSDWRSGFFEKGTEERTTKKGARRGRIRARHMLKVGIESVRGRKK